MVTVTAAAKVLSEQLSFCRKVDETTATLKTFFCFADVFDDVIGNVRASSGIGDLADDCMRGAVDV